MDCVVQGRRSTQKRGTFQVGSHMASLPQLGQQKRHGPDRWDSHSWTALIRHREGQGVAAARDRPAGG